MDNTNLIESVFIAQGVVAPTNAPVLCSIGYLEGILRYELRVTLDDNRIFTGVFRCTDRDCNIILSQAHEIRGLWLDNSTESMNKQKGRFVGLIVIPGKHIRKIETNRAE